MLFLDLSSCGPSALLRILYFLKILLDILFIIIPIGLIVFLTVDFAKMAFAGDEGKQKKTFNLVMKRLLNAVLVFLIPTIVNIFCSLLSDFGVTYTDCFTDLNMDAINQLAMEEEAIKRAEEEARLAFIAEQRAEEERLRKIREEALQNSNQGSGSGNTSGGNSGNSSTGTGNSGNSGNGSSNNSGSFFTDVSYCDGLVYYDVNTKTFYRPKYPDYIGGKPNTKGSEVYGYNRYFYRMLKQFVDDAVAAGHNIKMATGIDSWRSYDIQLQYWNAYQNGTGNIAAQPGSSNHGWGVASDLHYDDDKKWTNDYESAVYWAMANAGKYGLHFPMCADASRPLNKSSCSENWHIEPINLIIDIRAGELCD